MTNSPPLRVATIVAIVLIGFYGAVHAGTLKEFFQNSDLNDGNNYNPSGVASGSHDVLLTTPATALTLATGNSGGGSTSNLFFVGSLNVTSNAAYTIANVNPGTTGVGLLLGGAGPNSVSGISGDVVYLGGATTTLTIQGPNGGTGNGELGVSVGGSNFNVALPGATLNISANLSGTSAVLTKTGVGTLNLSGAVAFFGGGFVASGGTTNLLPGGSLEVSGLSVNNPNTGAGSDVTLNLSYSVFVKVLQGTVASPSTGTNRATLNLIGETTEIQVGSETAPDFNAIYAGDVAGNGSVVHSSSGGSSLTFAGANTYTGRTTIKSGTVRVNGTTSGQGEFQVGGFPKFSSANGTLGGTGTIGLKADGKIIVGGAVAGEITPGPASAIGTLHVVTSGTGSVVFGDRSIFSLEIGSAGASDLLAITGGSIDLTSAGDTLNLISLAGAFDGSTYTIATFDQNLGAGTFNSIVGLPSFYRVSYEPTSIRLIAVPEPSTLTAAIFGLGLLVGTKRSRPYRWS